VIFTGNALTASTYLANNQDFIYAYGRKLYHEKQAFARVEQK
jgi:hypothetical protein